MKLQRYFLDGYMAARTEAAWKDRITRIKWEIIAKVNEAGGEELAAK